MTTNEQLQHYPELFSYYIKVAAFLNNLVDEYVFIAPVQVSFELNANQYLLAGFSSYSHEYIELTPETNYGKHVVLEMALDHIARSADKVFGTLNVAIPKDVENCLASKSIPEFGHEALITLPYKTALTKTANYYKGVLIDTMKPGAECS